MARVVMFVVNDVRRDARVLREASTLAAAGHTVTVVGRPSGAFAGPAEWEARDGFEIVRVPVPGAWRRRLLAAGGGRSGPLAGRVAGSGSDRTDDVGRDRPAPSVAWFVRLARALQAFPVIGGIVRGLDLLVRWRYGTVEWGRAAAAAAPPADVWHAHDLSAVPAALAAQAARGGRFVYDAHELFTEAGDTATRPGWARWILRRFEHGAVRGADAVITVNAGLAAELERLHRPRRLIVVHNAPPLTGPTARTSGILREAAGIEDDVPIALYHGSFATGRGVDVLADALREPGMERVHAVFMGEGAEGTSLASLAADPTLGGRLHVLPPVNPDELPAWIAGADVGVMPIAPTTRNHRLSTPNKLFDCLSAGVPLVASDFPGIRQIVDTDPAAPLGLLVDPTSPAAVARAILTIVDAPPEVRRELRERCRKSAEERWNWEAESATLLGLYRDLDPEDAAPASAPDYAEVGPIVPQRITFVLPSSGAYDARTRRMAVGLADRGHDVLVIARSEAGLPNREALTPGAELVRVDAGTDAAPAAQGVAPRASRPAPWARGPLRLIHEAIRIGRTAARTRTQAREARLVDRPAERPAAIYHAMGFLALPVAIELAGRAAAPFVYDARDLYAEGNNIARLPRPMRALFARRERSWARRAAAVLTVNASLAEELERRLGIPRPAVVLNAQAPWTPPQPRPDRIRNALSLPAGTPIILYHGGFMRDRGLPEAIAAIRQPGLEKAHLVLMGSGPLEPEVVALAAAPEQRGRLHVLPPVPPAELLEWVASADVGIMPNQPRTINERLSTPNKLFECLAAGTPVVSSDFPERRRIIAGDPDGPLGALCDPTDPASIGAALRSILDLDPGAAADLRGRCLRATAERYDWETQFAVLLRVFGRISGRSW